MLLCVWALHYKYISLCVQIRIAHAFTLIFGSIWTKSSRLGVSKKKREWNQTPLKWNVFLLSIRYNSNRFRVSKTTFFTSSSSTTASHILMNATTKYLKNSNETIYILLLVINSLFCLFMTTTTTSSMLVFFRQLIQYDKIRLCTIMTPMNIK